MARSARPVLAAGLAVGMLYSGHVSAQAGQGQAATPPPMFTAGTNLVEVDATVLDGRGRFVRGLTADDLQLSENGQPQHITQFYMVSTETAAGSAGDASALDVPIERARRVFIFVFDEGDLSTGDLLRVKTGVTRFITEQLRPGDFGGVVVGGQMYQGRLTTDKAVLLAGVRAVRPPFDSRDSRMRPFQEFPRIPGESEAVRVANGDPFLTQDLGQQACVDDPSACQADGGEQQVENLLQQKARLYLGQSRDATRYTLETLRMVAAGSGRIPGRKTVVFFSEGFFTEESRAEIAQIGALAARGGTTIYSVDSRGLVPMHPDPDVITATRPLDTTFDTGWDGPAMLADGTGGLSLRHDDNVAQALAQVARDTSTYYVVGYQPTNGKLDNSFRTIELKAKAPGLHVRARTGYIAAPLPPMALVVHDGQ